MKKTLLGVAAAIAASVAMVPNTAPPGSSAGGNQIQTQQQDGTGGQTVNRGATPANSPGGGSGGSAGVTMPIQPRILNDPLGQYARTRRPYSFPGRKPYRPQRGATSRFNRNVHSRNLRRKHRRK